MQSTRYVIETGTIEGNAWKTGGFHEAINATDRNVAIDCVKPALNTFGYRDEDGNYVRVLDPEKHEIARLPLNEAFWSGLTAPCRGIVEALLRRSL